MNHRRRQQGPASAHSLCLRAYVPSSLRACVPSCHLIMAKQSPKKFADLNIAFEENAVCCKSDLAFPDGLKNSAHECCDISACWHLRACVPSCLRASTQSCWRHRMAA